MDKEKRLHDKTLIGHMREDRNMTMFKVTGMTCANCIRHVTEAAKSVSGVQSVDVDLEAGTASITGSADNQAIVDAIVAAGYEATF
jgi:copper chaperone